MSTRLILYKFNDNVYRFSKDILNALESDTILSDDERLYKKSVTSIAHKYVDSAEVSSHQYHSTVESAEDEQILLKVCSTKEYENVSVKIHNEYVLYFIRFS